jgi:hypothetical protein
MIVEHLAELLPGLLSSGGSLAQIVMAVILWRVMSDLRAVTGTVRRHGLALRKLAVGKTVALDDLESET